MDKRGAYAHAQVSMEYLMVVAFVFMIIMPFMVYFLTESKDTTEEIGSAQLSQIARKIVENSEKVYAFGEPTTLTLQVSMPSGVESASIGGQEISFILVSHGSQSTFVEKFPMNVSGSISTGEGVHKIRLQAVGGAVVISEVT
jgi:hypothetical protein